MARAWYRNITPGLILALLTLFLCVLTAFIHNITKDRIDIQRHDAALAELAAVLPSDLYDNDPLADRILVHDEEALGTDRSGPVYRARLHGQPSALVLHATAAGYSGAIELQIGIRADGRVLGVRVLAQHETAGLGDAIEPEKSHWLRGFSDRALGDPARERWMVRKDGGDFDQFSGATVTPRAVVGALRKALDYFALHREELFAG